MGRAETEAITIEAMVAKFIIIEVILGFILNGLSKTPLPETKEVNTSLQIAYLFATGKTKDLVISLIMKTIF